MCETISLIQNIQLFQKAVPVAIITKEIYYIIMYKTNILHNYVIFDNINNHHTLEINYKMHAPINIKWKIHHKSVRHVSHTKGIIHI